MPKKSNDNLFRLIKSMSTHEQRYFKLFAKRHVIGSQNIYSTVFDAIRKMEVYDEDVLKKTFHNKPFIKKFAITKSRLQETILKSLDAFHSESSIDAHLKRELHFIEILFRKGLYDECSRILTAARKLAMQYEKHLILLDILVWEKNLISLNSLKGKTDEDLLKILDDEKEIIQKISNESEYWHLKSRLFLWLNQHGVLRDRGDLEKFKSNMNHPLLEDETCAETYRSKYFYFHIYGTFYYATGDYEKSYIYLKKQAKLIESHPHILAQEPHNYITVLMNIINACHLLHRYDEIIPYLKKIRALPPKLSPSTREFLEIKVFADTYNIELALCIEKGEFTHGMSLLPGFEAGMKTLKSRINTFQQCILNFNLAVVCFGSGEYSSSLKWLNKILNDKTLSVTTELYCFSRILNLIVQLELGKDDLLPYTLKSTFRFLEKKKRLYRFETIFLEFIRKMSQNPDRKEEKKLFEKLRDELITLTGDPFEARVFNYFDFISWVESKLGTKSFEEIVQEKFRKPA